MTTRIITGDCRAVLADMPDESVHCVVTSPPYYGLRDYGVEPQVWGGEAGCGHEWEEHERGLNNRHAVALARGDEGTEIGGTANHRDFRLKTDFCRHCNAWRGSLGLEPTLDLYLDHVVEVFREVRRVMRKDATCFLNIGDSYASSSTYNAPHSLHTLEGWKQPGRSPNNRAGAGFKPKDLMLIPSRLAIRLQDDGWWVRSDIAWCKKAPMPESCTDRPTSAWEHVFLLTKSAKYFYDAEAVKEAATWTDADNATGAHQQQRLTSTAEQPKGALRTASGSGARNGPQGGTATSRNLRNFWLLGPEPFPEAHFATFPPDLVKPCILAGCPVGGTILDPFGGAGTVGLVADRLQRNAILIELSPAYADMARRRIERDAGMFAEVAAEWRHTCAGAVRSHVVRPPPLLPEKPLYPDQPGYVAPAKRARQGGRKADPRFVDPKTGLYSERLYKRDYMRQRRK